MKGARTLLCSFCLGAANFCAIVWGWLNWRGEVVVVLVVSAFCLMFDEVLATIREERRR